VFVLVHLLVCVCQSVFQQDYSQSVYGWIFWKVEPRDKKDQILLIESRSKSFCHQNVDHILQWSRSGYFLRYTWKAACTFKVIRHNVNHNMAFSQQWVVILVMLSVNQYVHGIPWFVGVCTVNPFMVEYYFWKLSLLVLFLLTQIYSGSTVWTCICIC